MELDAAVELLVIVLGVIAAVMLLAGVWTR
jgi:hypothetical protein